MTQTASVGRISVMVLTLQAFYIDCNEQSFSVCLYNITNTVHFEHALLADLHSGGTNMTNNST